MNKNYFLEELSEGKFEHLVGMICNRILGMGTIIFSKGKDGGKDARFDGIANKFPSENSPWKGLFIIQAKHTDKSNASCSDKDFSSPKNKSSVINKEIGRLNILIKEGLQIDNYLIFTNRKYSAIKGEQVLEYIREKTGIINCSIIGLEKISQILFEHHELPGLLGLGRDEPLRFSPEDLKEIILAFHENWDKIRKETAENDSFDYVDKESKNKLNNLTKEYFDWIKIISLPYFNAIDEFLKDPVNEELRDYFEDFITVLNSKIIEVRGQYNKFDEIINRACELITESNTDNKLKGKKKLVYLFLHYMYYNCHIGVISE